MIYCSINLNIFGRECFGGPAISYERRECEQYFLDTIRRNPSGRFIVKLSLQSDVSLGDSKLHALKRLEWNTNSNKRRVEKKIL